MPRNVTVTLSPAQARAVNAVLAYADSGEPEEAGLRTERDQEMVRRARAALQAAMEGNRLHLVEPDPEPGPVRAYGSPGIQSAGGNHDLLLIWRKPLDFQPSVEARIPVEDIPDFLRQVTSTGVHCIQDALTGIGYGDCGRCGNTRLVDVEVHGRRSNTRCPDCKERVDGAHITAEKVLREAPTIGPKIPHSWVKDEGWVL